MKFSFLLAHGAQQHLFHSLGILCLFICARNAVRCFLLRCYHTISSRFDVGGTAAILRDLELLGEKKPKSVFFRRLASFRVEADKEIPMAIDGELSSAQNMEFRTLPGQLPFIGPAPTESASPA